MKRFTTLAALVIAGLHLLAAPAHAATYPHTFDSVTRELVATNFTLDVGEQQTDTFELTNNTGQTWLGFTLDMAFGEFLDGSYSGTGTGTISKPTNTAFLNIAGISIADGGALEFDLTTVGGTLPAGTPGQFYFGEPSVVPIPAALPLLATGLAGLVWLRRRRTATT